MRWDRTTGDFTFITKKCK